VSCFFFGFFPSIFRKIRVIGVPIFSRYRSSTRMTRIGKDWARIIFWFFSEHFPQNPRDRCADLFPISFQHADDADRKGLGADYFLVFFRAFSAKSA
jgi:hypothetical protein